MLQAASIAKTIAKNINTPSLSSFQLTEFPKNTDSLLFVNAFVGSDDDSFVICPLVVLLFYFFHYNSHLPWCGCLLCVFTILKIPAIHKLIQYHIIERRFLKQTILSLPVKLLVLTAIYKVGHRSLQCRENTIFENNWKLEETTMSQELALFLL